jgi:hypothetical protein
MPTHPLSIALPGKMLEFVAHPRMGLVVFDNLNLSFNLKEKRNG